MTFCTMSKENSATGVYFFHLSVIIGIARIIFVPSKGLEITNEPISKTEAFSDAERFVIFSLDEMKIKEDLVWD